MAAFKGLRTVRSHLDELRNAIVGEKSMTASALALMLQAADKIKAGASDILNSSDPADVQKLGVIWDKNLHRGVYKGIDQARAAVAKHAAMTAVEEVAAKAKGGRKPLPGMAAYVKKQAGKPPSQGTEMKTWAQQKLFG